MSTANQTELQRSDSEGLKSRFKSLCFRYTDFLNKENVKVRPFKQNSLPLFSALPLAAQSKAISEITAAIEVFEEMQAEKQSLADSPKLIWRGLKKLGWTPRGDVFDKIGEDVVIIYSAAAQKQVFQNLRFFDFTSFSLEEIYASAWYEYSRREAWAEQALHQAAVDVIVGKEKSTFDPGVGEHLIEEVGTEELLKTLINVRLLSPIMKDEKVVGVFVINHCKQAGAPTLRS
jgi:hypothetical protein